MYLHQKGHCASLTTGQYSQRARCRLIRPRWHDRHVLLSATDNDRASSSGRSSGISEDVLARLKAAEDEAARLRKELAAAQSDSLLASGIKEDVVEAKPRRVDGADNRETLFNIGGRGGASGAGIVGGTGQKRGAWLSEADVDFFVGRGPSESAPGGTADQSALAAAAEAQGAVNRRLLIGALGTAALVAFALVPTQKLRVRPPKPLYFYIVPLLRIQRLLEEDAPGVIADAEWGQLAILQARVIGQPNNLRTNLDNCIALVDDTPTQGRAADVAAQLYEYVDSINYNKYFDAIPRATISGAQQAQFVDFSSKALGAARKKLTEFLALLPASEVANAKGQLEI